MGLLAAAVREYKQHRRQRVVVVANLEPRPDVELSEKQIATIQHQAVGINANAPWARQGCCARAYSDCATCGRANTSKCHQRKCYRRQSGGGGGGCCGGNRRPARVPEAATVYPTAREVEPPLSACRNRASLMTDPRSAKAAISRPTGLSEEDSRETIRSLRRDLLTITAVELSRSLSCRRIRAEGALRVYELGLW